MPLAENYFDKPKPVRVFAYGVDKTQKTTWALQAAEAGFRVLLFNFDNGAGVVARLSAEARKRVYILDVYDGVADAFAAHVATAALRQYVFWIDEATRQVFAGRRPGFTKIDMREFGPDTVVVWDSYTALITSLQRDFAFTQNIDLADAQKQEWPGYGFVGRAATWFVTQLKACPFHTITIGHSTYYERHKKNPADGKPLAEIELQKEQPVSSSNPHAMTITRDFNEVLRFHKPKGPTVWIDTQGDDTQSGGSRQLPPRLYRMEELSFATLAGYYGVPTPSNVAPWQFPVEEQLQIPGISMNTKPVATAPVIAQPVVNPTATLNLQTQTTDGKPVVGGGANKNPLILGALK